MDESFFIILINFVIITLGSPFLVYHCESNIKRFKTTESASTYQQQAYWPQTIKKKEFKRNRRRFLFFLNHFLIILFFYERKIRFYFSF